MNIRDIKRRSVLFILSFMCGCFILYCKWFKRPTVKNIVTNQVEEQTKIVYYNNIMSLNQKISKQKRLIIDLQERKDFLERTLMRLKTTVLQSEERDEMIKLWESDLTEVDQHISTQQEVLQAVVLEYTQVKTNGINTQ